MWPPCGYWQEVGWEGADPGINQLDARVCGVMEEQVGPPQGSIRRSQINVFSVCCPCFNAACLHSERVAGSAGREGGGQKEVFTPPFLCS